jgi:hypothetical protein
MLAGVKEQKGHKRTGVHSSIRKIGVTSRTWLTSDRFSIQSGVCPALHLPISGISYRAAPGFLRPFYRCARMKLEAGA